PSEVKRLPGREYLAARNQAKLTIKRSRHRAVREIAAKCPTTPTRRHADVATRSNGCTLSIRYRRYRRYQSLRALTDNQFWTQELERLLDRFSIDHAQKYFHAAFSLLGEIMVNRGQRWLEESRFWKVVVSDHGNFLGHLDIPRVEGS
ncbi:MAG: hypothetical protein QOH31_6456, partial [Verrucomicrobiota bacterium]